VSALLLVLAALQGPPPPALDEGTFVVRQDTIEIAREYFRLFAGRPAGGWSLAATTRYNLSRPSVVLAPILELAADSTPLALQYDVGDPRDPVRILGQAGRNRFTLRYLARASERARELAAAPNTVVLDDSVFVLYLFAAWRARPSPGTLTAILPRRARREVLTIQDLGMQPTTLNRDPTMLRHVAVNGGAAGPAHLWLDPEGHLMKVDLPMRHLVAERRPAN